MSAEPLHDRVPGQAQGLGPDRRRATAHGQLPEQPQGQPHVHLHGHGSVHEPEHAHVPAHAFAPERSGQPQEQHGPHSKHTSHAHTPAAAVAAEPIELAAGSPSLLMRGAGARIAGALAMICTLWLAVAWAVVEVAP